MNKKIFLLGLIVIVGTGFYINGLINNDAFEVTSFGTAFDVPCDAVELIKSENGTDIFGYNQNGQFYYAISFNASENPDLYLEIQNMICKGKKYQENGVVFYEQTSQVLGNNFNVWTGVNLAIKDQTTAGSFIKNDTTGECIVCFSNNWKNVVDTLEDVDWGNKTPSTFVTNNTDSNDDYTVEEPVYEDSTANTTSVANKTDDKSVYDNADGVGLSDVEWSKQHEKEIQAYQKGLEDAGYFDNFEDEDASDDTLYRSSTP